MVEKNDPGPNPENEKDTITVPVEVELDDVHAPAWEELKAASVDEETAREQLGEVIGQAADTDTALYQCYREVKQQRQQAMQGLAAQMHAQQAEGDDGEDEANAD